MRACFYGSCTIWIVSLHIVVSVAELGLASIN